MPKVLTDFLESLYVRWVWRPRTNLYRIGGDPLTQLKNFKYIFWNFFSSYVSDSDKINGKYVVGDPMTQLKLIK